MIALHTFMSLSNPQPPPNSSEDGLASFIISMADFCGEQEDGNGGTLQLWTLRKSLRGHPVGSTVTRQTLEAAYRSGVTVTQYNYGKVGLFGLGKKPKDFDAVEKPE